MEIIEEIRHKKRATLFDILKDETDQRRGELYSMAIWVRISKKNANFSSEFGQKIMFLLPKVSAIECRYDVYYSLYEWDTIFR